MGLNRRLYLLLLLLLALGLGAGNARGQGPASRFPIWKDVPGSTFAVLSRGSLKGTEWAAFASRAGTSARSGRRPCITVARFTRNGRYSSVGGCGPLAPEMGLQYPPIHPLLGETGAAYFAVSLSRSVGHIEIEFGSGRIIEPAPRMLSKFQAKKTHLPQFGYVAMALSEDACISRLTALSHDGQLILDSDTHEC
jgi:hypothetical protein